MTVAPTTPDPLAALAAFAAEAAPPPEAAAKARACLLYGLAVALASTRAEGAWRIVRAQDREGHTGSSAGARRWLDGRVLPAGEAALANAVLAHVRIQEDAHPAGHVGVVVLPAALAAAEVEGAAGAELLAAIVVGYEVALRLGRDHAAAMSARGFRTTPVYGVIGAAAAVGRLLGLEPARMANALALAANLSGGLRAFVPAGTGEYAVQAGFAARGGVSAAVLAALGQDAAPAILTGPAGFFAAFAEAGDNYAARVAADLGSDFEMQRITYKPYPICQFHRGVVRGLALLRGRAGGADPEAIEVGMHPFEADFFGVRYAGPFASFPQTFMSVPFLAALAWCDGDARFDRLHAFAAPEVMALVPRVEVMADLSRPRYRPRLAVRLADGRTLTWEESAGEDAYRLSWEAAVDMARRLADEAGIAAAEMRRLVETVEGLEDAPTVVPLAERICRLGALARAAREPVPTQPKENAR